MTTLLVIGAILLVLSLVIDEWRATLMLVGVLALGALYLSVPVVAYQLWAVGSVWFLPWTVVTGGCWLVSLTSVRRGLKKPQGGSFSAWPLIAAAVVFLGQLVGIALWYFERSPL